jgi:Tol biopolymer transport system component
MKISRMPAEPNATPRAEDRLDSWKEIATYLRKGVRTVQRWERTDGLPVRRLGPGSVFAYKAELDAWWQTQSRRLVAEPEPAVEPSTGRRAFPWWRYAIALFLTAAIAFAIWRMWPASPAAYRPVPFTSDHGWESGPTFSPDGRQIAYTWTPPSGRPNIYVKTVGSDSRTRLTSDSEPDGNPAWSPDGRSIAFMRPVSITGRWAVMRIAATGGAESRIAELAFGSNLSWSADGQWLIAIDGPVKRRSIVAISVADGVKHALTSPFEFGYSGYGLSPDGKRLIFTRNGPGAVPVYELPLGPGLMPAGEPRQITGNLWIAEMRAAADGKQIIYIDGSWEEGSLRRLWLSPGAKPEVIYATPDNFLSPAISRDGRRIAFGASRMYREEIWQKSLSDPTATPSPLLSSTHSDLNPQYSPDGHFIAFHSTRTGASDIWIADPDGSNPRRLTFTNARTTATPRWSPDGKWIAFESNQPGQTEVYVAPSGGGPVRRLTDNPATDAIPRWSRDGQHIYFCSNRTGRFEVWKIAASGGPPVQVTTNGGFVAVESPDGRYLYYSQTRNFGPILRMPLAGGPSEEVIPDIRGLFFAVTGRGIYFESRDAIWFWDAESRRTQAVFAPARPMGVGLDVSPDGRTLLFTQKDLQDAGADLYLIDGFR